MTKRERGQTRTSALPLCEAFTCRAELGTPRWGLVWIQWLLIWAEISRHMLQVHPNARPRGVAAAHRIDENIGRL